MTPYIVGFVIGVVTSVVCYFFPNIMSFIADVIGEIFN
jgi:hypothetical protein